MGHPSGSHLNEAILSCSPSPGRRRGLRQIFAARPRLGLHLAAERDDLTNPVRPTVTGDDGDGVFGLMDFKRRAWGDFS